MRFENSRNDPKICSSLLTLFSNQNNQLKVGV
jgi:hypothetical protein